MATLLTGTQNYAKKQSPLGGGNVKRLHEITMVILTAGKGERLGMLTLALAKPAADIVGMSIAARIILQGLDAGIRKFVIVISPEQEHLKQELSPTFAQQKAILASKRGKYIHDYPRIWNEPTSIEFVVQEESRGKGDAIALACAFPIVFREEFFVLAFGDSLFQGVNPVIEAIDAYYACREPIVMLSTVPKEMVSSFGVAKYELIDNSSYLNITQFKEKPTANEAPSQEVANGLYIITRQILTYLSTAIADGRDGELRVANLFESHKEKNRALVGCITKAKWYDTGDQKGLDRTRLSYGLDNPKTAPDLEQELISLGWTKNPSQPTSQPIITAETPELIQSAD